MSRITMPMLLASLCAGCAGEAPQNQPDPVKVDRLLASLEPCSDPCVNERQQPLGAKVLAEASLPKNLEEKVQRADRLVPALERVQSDKIDPSLAAALILR